MKIETLKKYIDSHNSILNKHNEIELSNNKLLDIRQKIQANGEVTQIILDSYNKENKENKTLISELEKATNEKEECRKIIITFFEQISFVDNKFKALIDGSNYSFKYNIENQELKHTQTL